MAIIKFIVAYSVAVAFAAEYEWAGVFSTPQDKYVWTAQKVGGGYADATMKLVVLPAQKSTAAELDSLKAHGDNLLKTSSTCSNVTFGKTITPSMNTCYRLRFDTSLWQSLYVVDTSNFGAVAFFAEHVPTEFENTAHYLKDSIGTDIEPDAELPVATPTSHEEEKAKPWGAVIGAAVITNCITFAGVVLLFPALKRCSSTYDVVFSGIISGFAGGALLSCSFFLLLFEATHLVATGWEKEVDILWRWGTMILAGFILPAVIHSMAGLFISKEKVPLEQKGTEKNLDEQKTNAEQQGTEKNQDARIEAANQTQVDVQILDDVMDLPSTHGQQGTSTTQGGGIEKATPERVQTQMDSPLDALTRCRLIAGVLLGDFFHNLCDGFFLGAAFSGCGDSFGWKVAVATFLHEIPQEVADFAILIGPEASVSPIKALAANFISGMGVLLGALIIVAAEVKDCDTGLLLAFGGGVYLHVAATECMPKVYQKGLTTMQNFACLGAFVVGAVLIGLILLDHEHCVPVAPGGEVSSGGHGH